MIGTSRKIGTLCLFSVVLLVYTIAAFGKESKDISIEIDRGEVIIERCGRMVVPHIRGGVPLARPGEPDLPYIPLFITLPSSSRATSITLKEVDEELLLSDIEVKKFRLQDENDSLDPEFGVEGNTDYVVKLEGTQYLRGIPLAVVRFLPFRIKNSSQLYLIKRVRFNIQYERVGKHDSPRVMSRVDWDNLIRSLKGIIVNPEDLSTQAPSIFEAKPMRVSRLPTNGDSPVSEVIICDENLLSHWEEYARYRRRWGIYTVVRTIQEIEGSYPGVDRAERLRNFIKDAYLNWGVSFVLLGGDAPFLPMRIINADPPGVEDPIYTNFPSDYYFSCLDGNWNHDGDTVFCETYDQVDFLPDVFVGRVPAQLPEDVDNYLSKVMTYERYPGGGDPSYLTKALFVGSDLHGIGDGCSLAVEISQSFPLYFRSGYVCESGESSPSTQEFIDSLVSGYNFVTVHGHGNFTSFNISMSPRETFTSTDADFLANVDFPSIFCLASCEPVGFDYDCIGEHMIRSKGCAVGVTGWTRFAYTQFSFEYHKSFFDSLFFKNNSYFGTNFYLSALPFLPTPDGNIYYYYVYPSAVLMGDPALLMWDSIPRSIEISLSLDTLRTLSQTLEVQIRDSLTQSGVPNVRVSIYKEGDLFGVGETDLEGKVTFLVKPHSPGTLTVSVSCEGITPKLVNIPVLRGSISLQLKELLLLEDDGDGIIEPSESLSLYPKFFNGGDFGTGPFTVYLVPVDGYGPFIEVVDSIRILGVPPRGEVTSDEPFVLKVSSLYPDSIPVPFRIVSVSQETLDVDTEVLVARSPRIEHYGHRFVEAQGVEQLSVSLINRGGGEADGVFLKIFSPDVNFIVDSIFVGHIGINETLLDSMIEPFVFGGVDSISKVPFYLIIGDKRGVTDTCQFFVKNFRGPPHTYFFPLIGGIKVYWPPMTSSEYSGYFVYRSQDSVCGFERLNKDPIPMSFYKDYDVEPDKIYYYKVTLVDTFWNESPPSTPLKAYQNPSVLEGWPRYVGTSSSTPLVADIVKEIAGLEVLVGGYDGTLRLFDSHGNILEGWPQYVGGNITGSPAAGDIDGDGDFECIVTTWGDTGYVFAYEGDGSQVEGWPRPIEDGDDPSTWGVFSSPVLADLDLDGIPEVIVRSMNGDIYVWRGDGTGFLDPYGFFLETSDSQWSLSGVSVGDIDRDSFPEIVFGTADGELHVVKGDKEEMDGFPVRGLSPILAPVVIADFLPTHIGLEIFVPGDDSLYLIDSRGNVVEGWPVPSPPIVYPFYMNPSISDINRDGKLEILVNWKGGVLAYDAYGEVVDSLTFHGGTQSSPTLVDLGVDNHVDLFIGSEGEGIQCFELPENQVRTGFPIALSASMASTPVLMDVNNDGNLNLVGHSGDGNLWIFDLSATYSMEKNRFEWPTHRHDVWRTGCFDTPQTGFGVVEKKRRSSKFHGVLMLPPFPSPFTESSYIPVKVGSKREITLKVYDSTGRLVYLLFNGELPIGTRIFEWRGVDGRGRMLPSGVYFIRLENGGDIQKNKVLKVSFSKFEKGN